MADITERMQAEERMMKLEEQLKHADKLEAIGQLAGGIAHDFNSVLTGIIGYARMSLRHAEGNAVLKNNILTILNASDRAQNLVNKILTFSSHGHWQKTETAIGPIIREVLELLRASIPPSIVIEAAIETDVHTVMADPTNIHEIILNLATNAVHAMGTDGTLIVRLFSGLLEQATTYFTGEIPPGMYTVIEVSDTGCGMDAVTRSKVFEPFFTTKRVGEGTGMGLSVVLGAVKSHSGSIDVESEIGRGSTFRVYLPASREASIE